MVPKALRYRAVDQAHVGNQGIFLSERLFREKFWFSGVGNMVKEKVESCLPCQAATTGKAERVKPRKMATPPSALWKELAMDFLRLPSEEYLKRIQPFPRS